MKKTILFIMLAFPVFAHAGSEQAVIDILHTYSGAMPLKSAIPIATSPTQIKAPPLMLSGDALFKNLERSAKPNANHAFSYSEARKYMYGTADQINCNGRSGILTLYSQICAYGHGSDGDSYKERGDENKDGIVDRIVNAEHLWPQSFFKKSLPMVADLHHLQSTFQTPNGRRSNFPFCETESAKYQTSAGSKLSSYRACFEPADAVKGNVARAMLYFVTVYHDRNIKQGACNYKEFWKQNVDMFLRWNRQDPPDAQEQRRNELIYQYQGNRNPYIDDYTLADRVGAEVFKRY